jgi:hypothetical protein
MSVNMGVYVVDWAKIQERFLHPWTSDDPELEDFSYAYQVLTEFEEERLSTDSAKAPLEFLDCFDAFKRAWKSDSSLDFRKVFGTILWYWWPKGVQARELEKGNDERIDFYGIDTALTPETLRELAKAASRFDLEECRPHYMKYVKSDRRFETFEEWKGYGEEWLNILRRAAAEDKGLIVSNFS